MKMRTTAWIPHSMRSMVNYSAIRVSCNYRFNSLLLVEARDIGLYASTYYFDIIFIVIIRITTVPFSHFMPSSVLASSCFEYIAAGFDVSAHSVIIIPVPCLLRHLRPPCWLAHDDTVDTKNRNGGLCRKSNSPRFCSKRVANIMACGLQCAVGFDLWRR
jgi:hypothetical protein